MIGKLRGKVDAIGESFLIVDVGGVGYEVQASARTLRNLKIGDEVKAGLRTLKIVGISSGGNLVAFVSDMPSGPVATAASIATGPARGGGKWMAIAAVAVLGVLLTAGFFAMRRRDHAGNPTGAADLTSAGATQAVVTVHATPNDAKIYFDDAPLAGNPATVTFNRDGLAHRVRAEAPNFSRKSELVVLDSSNVSVSLDLQPEAKDDEVDPFGNKLTAVTIKAVPLGSRLFLDSVLLPSNPASAKYPRDGKKHEVRSEAPGFLTKTETVTFDLPRMDVMLAMDKDPKSAAVAPVVAPRVAREAPAPATAPVAPPPTEAPAPAVAPTPAPKASDTKKTLDRSDPWK